MSALEIPEHAGAILLPDCVTFPQGGLPLHIFEPRYRKMLDDALEGNFMICVGNLIAEETEDPSKCVAKIGTIGLIRASREQQDGRSNLVLHAISRVEFLGWDTTSPYPKAHIQPLVNLDTSQNEETKLLTTTLRHAINQAISDLPEIVTTHLNQTLDRIQDDLATLTDVVAQQFIADTKTRQSLLEQPDPKLRAEVLTKIIRTL